MAFSDQFLDEIRTRVPVSDVVGRRVKLIKRGREYVGLSPFNSEKTPSFTVNDQKRFYHCFSSGEHGDVFTFVMKTEGLSFPEAVERLAAEAGLDVPKDAPEDRAKAERRAGLIEAQEAATQWFQAKLNSPAGRHAADYLRGRGLDAETVQHFRLGFAPDQRTMLKEALLARGFTEDVLIEAGLLIAPEDGGASYDRFRNRVMFPITDRRGRVIAFGGRTLGESRAKYLNSPETPVFHKGNVLYNLGSARQAAHEAGVVIVTEGYMDVIALHRAGFKHAVAPLGTALTEAQIAELWRLAPEPVLCLDGDNAGRRAAQRAAERALPLLQPGKSLRFAELPGGDDPDSLLASEGPSALQRVLDAALPLAEVLWRGGAGGRPLDTPERRAGLRRDLGRMAAEIRDETVRTYYRQYFAEQLDSLFAGGRGGAKPAPGGRRRGGRYGAFTMEKLPARHSLGQGGEVQSVRRERLLTAVLLNHPVLLEEVWEDYASLTLSSPALDSLRNAIIKQAGLGEPLDFAGLKDNLSGSAQAELISLSGPNAADLEPFARPDADLNEARAGWVQTLGLHRLEGLRLDLNAAAAVLAQDMTEENYARYLALKQEFDRAQGAATSLDAV